MGIMHFLEFGVNHLPSKFMFLVFTEEFESVIIGFAYLVLLVESFMFGRKASARNQTLSQFMTDRKVPSGPWKILAKQTRQLHDVNCLATHPGN